MGHIRDAANKVLRCGERGNKVTGCQGKGNKVNSYLGRQSTRRHSCKSLRQFVTSAPSLKEELYESLGMGVR